MLFRSNPELALLKVTDQYEAKSIGFVFHNCAIGVHLAVILRKKGMSAIKLSAMFWKES